ncbi:MAG TPA: bifunctional DNA-formamidopyrimidine glycosylase/DNA-(apurinic or apyrimidinic site) lyase [Candidatus Acidoferrales bacterium]|nr:bifunctional DNA-formamidopyrimidine glycosylase/DNA-(apurinic or apyrimidinic site) lyase [Candidatus Acidoferrales bacterium]
MPELPEVETVRLSLLPLVGGRIGKVEVREARLRRRVADDFAQRLRLRTIERIDRRGKYLLFRLDGGETLLAHLGMSGALLLQHAGTALETHDHVRLHMADGRLLTFNDPRRFGLMQIGREDDLTELTHVGPDPLAREFKVDDLVKLLRGRKKPVKNLLMDQQAIAGIGNIYANEMLFVAGIRPGREARRVTRSESAKLYEAMRRVLLRAIERGGSSISDYRDGDGRTGYFQLELAVYDRASEPCGRCGSTIKRVVHAGRSSFYCPRCQK